MKILTVSALVCALMALTTADGESDLFKRSASCTNGWLDSYGHCFLYHPTPTTWNEAEKYCRGYPGGHLASVHSADEYRAIQAFIQEKYRKSPVAWLGGSDAEQEGTWRWCDGSYFNPSYWTPRYTDRSRNCLMMNDGGQKFKDDRCSTLHPFVCATKK